MRAPPQPRRSKSRYIAIYIVKVRRAIRGRRLKNRWHLHKLHKLRRHAQHHGEYVESLPNNTINAEDMVNLPTALQNNSAKCKPLLIAAFPSGCSNSPQVRVLQRNRLSKVHLSHRKYKMSYNGSDTFRNDVTNPNTTHKCAHTVRSIKNATSKNADVKAIFHGHNIIKRTNLHLVKDQETVSPAIIEFGPQQFIPIKNLKQIRETQDQNIHRRWHIRKSVNELKYIVVSQIQSQPTKVEQGDSALQLDITSAPHESRLTSMVKITKYTNATMVSYSNLVKSINNISRDNESPVLRSVRLL